MSRVSFAPPFLDLEEGKEEEIVVEVCPQPVQNDSFQLSPRSPRTPRTPRTPRSMESIGVSDIARYVARAKGPATLVYADAFEERAIDRGFKSTGMCIPPAVIRHVRRNKVYFNLCRCWIDDHKQNSFFDAAILDTLEDGIDGEPLWQAVDGLVRIEQASAVDAGNSRISIPGVTKASDELWSRFWNYYRKTNSDALQQAAVENAHEAFAQLQETRREPLTCAPVLSNVASKQSARKGASSSRNVSEKRSRRSQMGGIAGTLRNAMQESLGGRSLREASYGKYSRHGNVRELVETFGPAKKSGMRNVSKGGGSTVYEKIKREYDKFEELAQKHEKSVIRSSDCEDDIDDDDDLHWMLWNSKGSKRLSPEGPSPAIGKSPDLTPRDLSVQRGAVLITEKEESDEESQTEKTKDGFDDGQSDHSEEIRPETRRKTFAPTASERKKNTRIDDLSRPRLKPVYCFAGFDDYKKHQIAPTKRRMDKNTREVLKAEATEPSWKWNAAMREHKVARTWRLREGMPDILRSTSKMGNHILEPIQGPSLPPQPPPNFQRPWSREGIRPAEDMEGTSCDACDGLDPLERYAKVCVISGVQPQTATIKFLMERSPLINIRGTGYSDEDLIALAASLPYSGTIEAADFGENPRLTDQSVTTIVEALAKRHAGIYSLRLDQCHRLGSKTISLCTTLLKSRLRQLQVFDLSGITIGIQEYQQLAFAIEYHVQLRDVRLAATGLGSSSKSQAVKIVSGLIANPRLQSLDLSWNAFDALAFEAIGRGLMEHQYLRVLSLASCGVTIDPAIGESPVLAFLEVLAGDTTLTELDISNNGLDGRAALVLESSARIHPCLRLIRMSDNPLGIDGLRSLLRLLAHPKNLELTRIVAKECKGPALPGQFRGPFDADPSGRYRLDMSRPSERALLRLLLTRLTEQTSGHDVGAASLSSFFRACRLRRHDIETPFSFDHAAKVPKSGVLEFDLDAEEKLLSSVRHLRDPVEVVEQISQGIRKPLLVRRKMLGVLSFVKGVEDTNTQAMLLTALGCDFYFTVEQAKALCLTAMTSNNCGKDSAGTCCKLLPCVIHKLDMRSLILCTSNLTEILRVEQVAHWLLNLDLENPSGHYELSLDSPSDRCTLERLLLLNRWQDKIWREKGFVDISQYGNRKNLRNEMLNGRDFVWDMEEWRIPSDGGSALSFDYISLSRPPRDSAPVKESDWSRMLTEIKTVLRPEASTPWNERDSQKVEKKMSRAHSRLIERMNSLISSEDLELVRMNSDWQKQFHVLSLSEKDALWALRALSSKIWITSEQLRELLTLFLEKHRRSDCLVYFMLRCIDWPLNGKMCRPKFSPESWADVRKRVGYITSFIFMQPEQQQFSLDLSIPEQRRVLHALIKLTQAEHPSNLKNGRIDWKGPSGSPTWDTFVSGIPLSWNNYDCIPVSGLFEALYLCSLENAVLPLRRRLASPDLGGWLTIPHEKLDIEKQLRWWCVLDDVPKEAVHLIVFIVTRWKSLTEAFECCDVNKDGKLNHREFTGQMLLGGFGKSAPSRRLSKSEEADSKSAKKTREALLAARDEKNREEHSYELLSNVYRWLDSSNDGDISQKEFSILEGIWRELWQSMLELKSYLDDWFFCVENAWDVAEKDDEDFMVYNEFLNIAEVKGFAGPISEIFMYLDQDSNGKIDYEEWMRLDAIGSRVID